MRCYYMHAQLQLHYTVNELLKDIKYTLHDTLATTGDIEYDIGLYDTMYETMIYDTIHDTIVQYIQHYKFMIIFTCCS